MMNIIRLTLAYCLIFIASGFDYCIINPNHTMCIYEGTNLKNCVETSANKFFQLNEVGRKNILEKMNSLRQAVAKGPVFTKSRWMPRAINMKKLVWNQELENIAQRYANQCEPYGYEYDTHMFMEASTSVVSAVFFGEPDPECLDENAANNNMNLIQKKYDHNIQMIEKIFRKFDPIANVSPAVVQMLWAETAEVGCGLSYYKNVSFLFIQGVPLNMIIDRGLKHVFNHR
ncbi:venom allergen 5 [Eurytemora carolleeae]|uniref:venom allergen 5 n=1 Tax=Eurytemora carolleeae TaxID=1294199 RepID=UPI000C75C998|nr:venom allergen 5 [Eurytemora carolleeae]|eukprot:XP_023337637.1 venom allergen 5-like [Eurytemora affinis]